MKKVYRIALVGLISSAMALIPHSTDAQTRRTTTGTTSSSNTSSGSENRSAAKRSTASSTSSTQRSTTAGTASSNDRQVRRTTGSSNTERNSTGNVTAGSNRASSNRSTGNAAVNNSSSGNSATGNTQTATGSAPVRATSVRSRVGLTSSNKASTGTRQEINYGGRGDAIRLDDDRNINRIPPRERGYMSYDRIPSFYEDDLHMYGYRIHTLPPSYKRYTYWGVDYYLYKK